MSGPERTTISATSPPLTDLTPLLRRYAMLRLWKLNRQDPARSQTRLLRSLLHRARNTRFGQAHDFARIADISQYQRHVPLRHYSDFWNDWWQHSYPDLTDQTWPGRIPYFSLTSGTTTGRSKFIPYTNRMKHAAVRGFLDLLCHHLTCRPDSRLLGGAALGLTGPAQLNRAAPGVDTGAVSAITAGALPRWLSRRVLPPPELANIENWQDKISQLAPLSLRRDVRFLGGSPNWLLIFADEAARHHPGASDRLVDLFPNLELIVHGGVNFSPYRQRFSDLMRGGHAETREMYSASEGVFAYADRGDGEGLRLHLDGQVFYEFVPVGQLSSENPDRFWIGKIETGVDYALAVTTAAGLWSYLVGDIVRFVDRQTPRIRVVGRLKNSLSAFGEHLIEAEITDAVTTAATALGLSVLDFCVGPTRDAGRNRHLFLIETGDAAPLETEDALARKIDAVLRARNDDYSELRKDDLALAPPIVRLVGRGGFMGWMKTRRGLGGQYKVPRVVTDEELLADIRDVVLNPHLESAAHDR